MKSLFVLLLISIIGCASPCENLKQSYRHNPFTFIDPDYYYKADIIELKSKKITDSNSTEIQLFDLKLKATIPGKWSLEKSSISKERTAYKITKNNSKDGILITNNNKCLFSESCKEDSTDDKDFCSAFKTPMELYEKLFTLTPDMENLTVGDLWIIHKKSMFENKKKIYIYKNKNFIAFRQDWDREKLSILSNINTEIWLFPYEENNNYLFLIISTNFSDNDLILQLLQSINTTSNLPPLK